MNIMGCGFIPKGRGKIYIMSVCVCKGTNKLHTHLHTQMRECDRGECSGIERGCRDKELRQWGGGVAAGVGAGGRVLGA